MARRKRERRREKEKKEHPRINAQKSNEESSSRNDKRPIDHIK